MPTAIGSPILTVHFTVGIRLPIDSDKAVFSCLLEVTNIESVVSNCPVWVLSIRIEKKVNYFSEVTVSD